MPAPVSGGPGAGPVNTAATRELFGEAKDEGPTPGRLGKQAVPNQAPGSTQPPRSSARPVPLPPDHPGRSFRSRRIGPGPQPVHRPLSRESSQQVEASLVRTLKQPDRPFGILPHPLDVYVEQHQHLVRDSFQVAKLQGLGVPGKDGVRVQVKGVDPGGPSSG